MMRMSQSMCSSTMSRTPLRMASFSFSAARTQPRCCALRDVLEHAVDLDGAAFGIETRS